MPDNDQVNNASEDNETRGIRESQTYTSDPSSYAPKDTETEQQVTDTARDRRDVEKGKVTGTGEYKANTRDANTDSRNDTNEDPVSVELDDSGGTDRENTVLPDSSSQQDK